MGPARSTEIGVSAEYNIGMAKINLKQKDENHHIINLLFTLNNSDKNMDAYIIVYITM